MCRKTFRLKLLNPLDHNLLNILQRTTLSAKPYYWAFFIDEEYASGQDCQSDGR